MHLSSSRIAFDDRLLAIEELVRRRKMNEATRELILLKEQDCSDTAHEAGLFCLLTAEVCFFDGEYARATDYGLKGAKLLARTRLHRRYARAQLVLSKCYSATGDLRHSEIRARDASSAYRRAVDNVGQIDALNELARIAFIRSDFPSAASFLQEALELVDDDPRKVAQLTGNLGRTRIHTGEWSAAEKDLTAALKYEVENDEEISQAINLLSLGNLHLKRRHFAMARRTLDESLVLISRLGLKREKIIYLEYAGELAFEKGDTLKAKSILSDAYQRAMLLAPGSGLVSQTARRLADVELALDNVDESMRYGQKAYEMSLSVGEKIEVGLSQRLIAQVFLEKEDYEEAASYISQALDTLREVGNPLALARTMLVMVDIRLRSGSDEKEKIRGTLEAAHRIFKRLKLDYWVAQSDLLTGTFACQQGDLTNGFKKLSRAEKVFASVGDKVRIRQVNKFLKSLADQAVALAVSGENEFKVFGNMVSRSELTDLKDSPFDGLLEVLLKKTGGSRAVVCSPSSDSSDLVASFPVGVANAEDFNVAFDRLLGQEIARVRPTLLMDCRRDPFIKELFPGSPDLVTAVMVIPFRMGEGPTSYLYIDRLTKDNTLRPFNQTELNFATAYSDLISFKWTEIEKNLLAADNRRLRTQLMEKSAFPNIITQSPVVLEIFRQVQQVVNSTISVVIEGETGSGKDLLARAIHYNSDRHEERFISVNCAALPETLLESELFGFCRGAFTGADRDKAGLFEEADGGTFFLDEIGDMPASIQAKVLRVLEQKEIVRLGETVPRKVDVRIVSATNQNLREMMEEGKFRADLYYRLSAVDFRLPPIRERREDIPLLIQHFLQDKGKQIAPEVIEAMVAYDWPGNVRELENEVTRICLLAGDKQEIGMEQLSARIVGQSSKAPVQLNSYDVEFSEDYSLYDYLGQHERQFIIRALGDKKGVKKHAAAMLNIPESTLRLKIKQYGIDSRDFLK